MTELHAIVLAAGASTRFGFPKQLAAVSGAPMLQLVLNRAVELCGSAVSVVLGANMADIVPVVSRMGVTVVCNRNWAEGLASSIRAAIEQLPESCMGALIILGDQPAVSGSDLRRLADAWRVDRQAMAAAQYAEDCGVPAVFPRCQFPSLLALRGEQGARNLLRNPVGRLIRVPMPSAALDIDTPQDLASLRR
jgi:molybdenum cofactor cytidylyltransferase